MIIFHDYKFKVVPLSKKYRILEKEEFEKSWHSFVDVQAIRRFRAGVKYVTKYLTKTKNEVSNSSAHARIMLAFSKAILHHQWRST